jgi:hypothetical protein
MLCHTEAESRINEEMSAYISEEFKITNIKVANYAEIHPFENCDRWFKSKFLYWLMMKKVVKNERLVCIFLVQANDVRRLLIIPWESYKSTMGEYSIPAISESPIMDVFRIFLEDLEKKLKSLMHLKQLDLKLQQIQKILWNSLLKKKRLPKISN